MLAFTSAEKFVFVLVLEKHGSRVSPWSKAIGAWR